MREGGGSDDLLPAGDVPIPTAGLRIEMVVRAAVPSDHVAIARLLGQLGYPSTREETAARLEAVLARDDHAVFVADDGGSVCGWVHVLFTPRLEPPFVELGGLIVEESKRGSGVGRALIAAAEAWARHSGAPSLRVRTNMVRENAHRFYSRMGFEVLKTQTVFVKGGGQARDEGERR